MAKKIIKAQMKQRQDTKANWAAANPVLLDGELGMVSDDRNLYKVGDGRTAWNDLPFRGFDGTLAQELGTSANAAISQKAVTEKLTELSAETASIYFEKGAVAGDEETPNDYTSRSCYIPVNKGDVITASFFRVKLYNRHKLYYGEDLTHIQLSEVRPIDYTISSEECKYVRIVSAQGLETPILINGKNYVPYMLPDSAFDGLIGNIYPFAALTLEQYYRNAYAVEVSLSRREKLQDAILGIWVKNPQEGATYHLTQLRHRQVSPEWGNTEFSAIGIAKKTASVDNEIILDDRASATITDGIQFFETDNYVIIVDWSKIEKGFGYAEAADEYNQMMDAVLRKNNTIYLTTMGDVALKADIEHSIEAVDAKIEKESAYVREGITISFKPNAYDTIDLDYPLVKGMVITSIGKAASVVVGTDGYTENIPKAKLPFVVHRSITYVYPDTPNSGEMRVEGLLYGLEHSIEAVENSIDALQKNLGNKGDDYITMPIPQLAVVNIRAHSLPTTKTDDIQAEIDFNDNSGNVFTKNVIINAQGNSSLGMSKKNFSIDIVGDNYEGSHEIKFGDWVAQDGFHLKSYMWDGLRVKALACYDFYESILLTRGVRKDRAWKRLQLPSDIPMASNDIEDSYLQLDDGAKNHPSGFPVILYFNGIFYGIYCWQLKKHRDNYHQKKSKAEHIHLDGNISNSLLWEANGYLDWEKWAGKKQESEASNNVDGIEVRNPKKLILVDGSEYDADTNAGELISSNSAGYDVSNADMVRTASVRASIESLSRRVYALTQMSNGADKKTAIAEVFDVESIIDYIIFSQITGNLDGFKKNWQWVTYDGVKWSVNAYDLDGTWGWTSWSYYAPYNGWIHNDTPPVTLIIENYLDEIKVRYKELRDKGVIDLAKIMQPLVNYVKLVGIDYYDMEFEKWTDGERDNLWRFEAWMEESIKRTDALMSYNS